MIEAKNLFYSYGTHNVIKDVSLRIVDNKITAIIGANGVGKSTLLGLLTRLLPMDGGEVYLDGVNLKDIKSTDIAKKIGILKQSNNIGVKVTVRELVSYGRFPHSKGRITAEDEEMIYRSIEYLNLQDIENKYIDELSGGQRQRAFIAMILAQDTKYIFLDEPLNNLDMKYASELMINLQRIVRELNKTVVIVVHDINIASSFADYIIAMKGGKIYREGATFEVIEKKVLDHIYQHDFCIECINGTKVCVYNNKENLKQLSEEK